MDFLISARRPDLMIANNNNKKKKKKKKRTCRIVDIFFIPADHRAKLKESENRGKYLLFARHLKNLWNMKVTVIPLVTSTLRKVPNGLVQGLEDLEIRGREVTIQGIVFWRSARILIRVLETLGDLLHSDSNGKPSANADEEKLSNN